jgi:beta-lactamase superfamily II metal-dependent hydrolase
MTDTLTVRVYNVRFGDAILVTVPDRDPETDKVTIRRILIDVGNGGNFVRDGGGVDTVFKPVVEDIIKQLKGKPLDLYVMTHEHLDHVQGLPYAAKKYYPNDFDRQFRVNHVWLTGSSKPGYDDEPGHQAVKAKKLEFQAMYSRLRSSLSKLALPAQAELLQILENNNPNSTSSCVDFLRNLNPDKTTYVYRGVSLEGQHPFREAEFEIWAPEQNTSEYYSGLTSLALDKGVTRSSKPEPKLLPQVTPPAGVDLSAFLNIEEAQADGIAYNAMAIDEAANNTSVVFILKWRGWRLLFAGDAEILSWETMQKKRVLEPVHFLKVSHHGSYNGTPDGDIFEAILPKATPDGLERKAAISTWKTRSYPKIPDGDAKARIASRCELQTTLDEKNKGETFFDLTFKG